MGMCKSFPRRASTSCIAGRRNIIVRGVSAGRYGMGWFDIDLGQTKTFSHSGNVPDFSAFMALLPEQKKGVVLLLNADPYGLPLITEEVGMGVTALARRPAACSDPAGLYPVDHAPPAADPHSPDRGRLRNPAAVKPLAPGPGASPEQWTGVGAAYPASADPEPDARGYPGLPAIQRPAPFSAALYARPGLDCPDQRRLCRDMGLPAHRLDPLDFTLTQASKTRI